MTYKERLELYYSAIEKLQELEKIETNADYELSELIRRGNWKSLRCRSMQMVLLDG